MPAMADSAQAKGAGRRRGAVLVTGASTGIGRATALHLETLGFDVFAGVRREEDGERVAADSSGRCVPVLCDITDQAAIDAVAQRLTGELGDAGLHGLVNNAGIAQPAPIEIIPIDDFRNQLEVNLVGQVAVTQAMLPLLRRARGRIVNVGSVGGRVAGPALGAYAASKFALEGALRLAAKGAASVGDPGLRGRAGSDQHRDLAKRRRSRGHDTGPRPR